MRSWIRLAHPACSREECENDSKKKTWPFAIGLEGEASCEPSRAAGAQISRASAGSRVTKSGVVFRDILPEWSSRHILGRFVVVRYSPYGELRQFKILMVAMVGSTADELRAAHVVKLGGAAEYIGSISGRTIRGSTR